MRSSSLSLLLLSLFALLAPAAADSAGWSSRGTNGRLAIEAPDAVRSSQQSFTIALPEAGGWRVSRLLIDGLAADPGKHIALGEPFRFRRARAAQLVFTPPERDWLEAVVELAFDRPFSGERAQGAEDPLLADVVLNPGDLRLRGPEAGAISGRDGDDLFDGTGRFIRIDVAKSGVYRLHYDELWVNGVPPGTDTASFRLFGSDGRSQPFRVGDAGGSWERGWVPSELPVHVTGGASFGSGSELRVYLPGADGWASESDPGAGWEEYHRNFYSSWATYFLTWGEGPGARVGEVAAAPTGGDPVLATLPARVHVENNFEYSNQYLHEDGWAWHYFFPSTNPEQFGDSFPLLFPDGGAEFRLRVGYDAPRYGTDFPGGPHHVRGYLGSAATGGQADQEHEMFDEIFNVASGFSQVVLDGSRTLPAGEMEGAGAGRFTLTLPKDGEAGSLTRDFGYLLWYEVFYAAQPKSRGSQPISIYVQADQPRAQIASGGWLGEPEVWDVTDPATSARLTGGDWDGETLTFALDTPSRRHLILFDPAAPLGGGAPDRLRQVNPRPLRNDEGLPHMIVVYYDDFAGPATRLADWRSNHYPFGGIGEIEAVAISDIYANFGNGMQDVAALRNYLKYRYETPGSRLSFVLLLGDADSDYRNFLGREVVGDGSNCLVPALSDRFRSDLTDPYTTDDFVAGMDVEDDDYDTSVPDLAMGRLPAASLAAANQMVDMIIDYDSESSPGLWKNRIVIAADDNARNCDWTNHPDRIPHTSQAETVVITSLPRELDYEKLYMCRYDCDFAGFKPKAQQDLFNLLEDGVLLFNYIGHGGNDVLADEQLLLTSRLFSLRNADRRFMFVSASCNVGEYDDPSNVSMSETMIGMADGGAIATMASSSLSQAFFNNTLNTNFMAALFPDFSLLDSRAIGLALLRAKVKTQLIDSSGHVGDQNERYAILGDPSMRLRSPSLEVEFDAAAADTLRVGETVSFSGRILRGGRLAPDFNGELSLSVWASADTTGCDWGDNSHWDFNLPGPEIFRGRINVRDGLFTTPSFFVPGLPEGALGAYGRVRAFAVGREEAVGSREFLRVAPGILPADDTPPRVQVALAGGSTAGSPGMELTVKAESASGINLIGTHPRNSTFLEFVEAGLVENLTGDFEYDTGSASSGSASSRLPEGLPAGLNTIVASVADNLGNVSRDTLRVEMFEAGRADLRGVQPFPNPFDRRTAISFELTAAATVECDLYTLSGRRIRSLPAKDCPAPGRYAFDWDGRDRTGDEVANGTYLYRVVAVYGGNQSRRREETGAVVRMRD